MPDDFFGGRSFFSLVCREHGSLGGRVVNCGAASEARTFLHLTGFGSCVGGERERFIGCGGSPAGFRSKRRGRAAYAEGEVRPYFFIFL